jgi:hypothetical protein
MSVYLQTQMERDLNSWEWTHVHRRDTRKVSVDEARGVISHVYSLLGLAHPPLVRAISKDHDDYISGATAYMGRAQMTLQGPVSTSVLLHELAHAITEDPLDRMELRPLVERESHGPIFVTNFLFLLDKLMGPSFNQFYLRSTLPPYIAAKLKWHMTVWGKPLHLG